MQVQHYNAVYRNVTVYLLFRSHFLQLFFFNGFYMLVAYSLLVFWAINFPFTAKSNGRVNSVFAEAEEQVTTWGGRNKMRLGIVDKFLEFHVAMYT